MNLKGKLKKILLSTIAAGLISTPAFAQDKPEDQRKFSASLAGYYDTLGKPTGTFTLYGSNLPFGTSLFGFVDLEAEEGNVDNLKDPYMEVSLSKKAKNGLGVAVEYDRDFSSPDGVTRLGFLYEPNLSNAFAGIRFYPVATKDDGMQVVVYGNKSFNDGDMYLDGFFDYNFGPDKIFTQLQFGKKIGDDLFFVAEGRYNGFADRRNVSAGIGLEWKFN